MRIGLLLCGHLPDRYNSIAGDYPEMVSRLLGDEVSSLVVFDVPDGDLPEVPSSCDGYIISGSASSVYDDEAWIRDLEEFVRRATDSEVPIFGICFGHQILAEALGGSVERADNGWGIGVHRMKTEEHRPWMQPDSETLSLVMSHQDQVVRLPQDAVVLGSSDHCENFLVEFTQRSVGIQGHPEFPAPFAQAVYEDKRDQLGELVDDAIASLASPTDSDIVAAWMRNLLSSQR